MKKFWESKTFWVNVLGLVGGAALAVQGYLIEGGAISFWSIIQIVLRFMTKEGVRL